MTHEANFRKSRDERITNDFLKARIDHATERGYSKAKWVQFCEAMLEEGFSLTLYEARKTWSKYITVSDGSNAFRVRFSNHRPIKHRELSGDCDFFVGVTNTGYRNTDDAIKAVMAHFGRAAE